MFGLSRFSGAWRQSFRGLRSGLGWFLLTWFVFTLIGTGGSDVIHNSFAAHNTVTMTILYIE